MNQRKVYYSFNDMPVNRGGSYDIGTAKHGIKFSGKETVQLFISMMVLTVAFSFVFVPYPPLAHLAAVVGKLPLSFLAIITAFFCHETAHKYMGQKYGYWSEFRMFPQGLLLALFLGAFAGIVFAAPGAVQIFGRPTSEESGKIAAAGPSTNIVICILFTAIWFFSDGALASISFFIAYINAFLALFNMLPFGPLDGLKVFRWKKEVWGTLLVINLAMFIMLLSA